MAFWFCQIDSRNFRVFGVDKVENKRHLAFVYTIDCYTAPYAEVPMRWSQSFVLLAGWLDVSFCCACVFERACGFNEFWE